MAKTTDIERDIDGLFQLSPGEFTAARNALASRLKKSGHAEEAEQVKTIPKPSISAWTVNQLFWRNRKAFDDLIEAGGRFRKAQAAQLSGKTADIRGLLEERREALADLSRIAAEILRDAGHNPTPDTMRRVTTTLEALATYAGGDGAPQAGRLSDDIDPPGFEALAALVPDVTRAGRRGGDEPTRVLPFKQSARAERAQKKREEKKLDPREAERRREEERRARRAEAKNALEAAEKSLREARRTAERAEAELKKAAARAKAATKEKEDLEKRFEKLVAEADEATREAHRVAREAEEAAQAVSDAERDVERARTTLNEVE